MSTKKSKKIKDKYYEEYGSFGYNEYDDHEDFLSKLDIEIIPKLPPRNYPVSSLNRSRLMFGFFVLVTLLVLLIFRMGYWQIIKSDDLKEMATSMQKVDTEIKSLRGNIYDSKMNILAETVTEYELYAYTHEIYKSKELSGADKDRTLANMAEITGREPEELLKKLEGEDNLVLICDGLTKEAVDKAEKLWGSGVYVKTKTARYYPNGAFAAQLLGGVNTENTGRAGLEYEYNSVLAGIKGRTVKTTDSQGNTLAGGNAKTYQAQDGYNLVTTIDSVIQHYVEDALEEGMKKTGASGISCIVMDPKTGDVLALAATPEYDPNNSERPSDDAEYKKFKAMNEKEQSEYLSRMWTVEQVSNIYEPGSTFKLIAAATALETGTATMNSTYYCGGSIGVGNIRLNCLGHHGTQDLKDAVGNSCNAALARVALDLGSDKYYNYIEMFGFRDRTGIDLPGETFSIVKNPSGMGDVDLATTGYGQGIAITPIQLMSAVNCFGNDGIIMQPKIVKKIVDKDGKTVQTFEDKEIRQAVSKETADQMREIMEYYVSDAGGDQAYVAGYRIGGKTGTANIASGGGYSSSTDCSFLAMAPMDDPQISMIVIVHQPTKTTYGNDSAGPIVKSVMEKSLMYLGVEREYTDKEASNVKKNQITVPNVTGKDSKKAIEMLTAKKLKYTFVPENNGEQSFVVQDQYPKAGEKVTKNTVVYLYSQ